MADHWLITAWLEVRVLPGPPPNKINGLTDILAAVATVVGDRFYTLRKLALPALVRFRGDADMTGALIRLDLSKVTQSGPRCGHRFAAHKRWTLTR